MRHDLDPWSLLFGLVFAAVAVVGLTGGLDRAWAEPDLWAARTLVPTALILVGLLLGAFATSMLRLRSRGSRDEVVGAGTAPPQPASPRPDSRESRDHASTPP